MAEDVSVVSGVMRLCSKFIFALYPGSSTTLDASESCGELIKQPQLSDSVG